MSTISGGALRQELGPGGRQVVEAEGRGVHAHERDRDAPIRRRSLLAEQDGIADRSSRERVRTRESRAFVMMGRPVNTFLLS